MNSYSFDTPIGVLTAQENSGRLCAVRLGASEGSAPSPVTVETKKQLIEYFEGKRQGFDLPIELNGTEFQKSVWRELMKIPYGETRSYKDIAEALGKPKAYRAVGGANGKNPLLIIVPCHRVIAEDGGPGGYTGGLDIKRLLLKTEGKIF